MSNLDYKLHYRKNLPHIQPPGAVFFVTCRLAGSLPQAVLMELKEQEELAEKRIRASVAAAERAKLLYLEKKRTFGRFDAALDMSTSGPAWLKQPEVAAIVMETLHYLDGRQYELDVFCNHEQPHTRRLPAFSD